MKVLGVYRLIFDGCGAQALRKTWVWSAGALACGEDYLAQPGAAAVHHSKVSTNSRVVLKANPCYQFWMLAMRAFFRAPRQ